VPDDLQLGRRTRNHATTSRQRVITRREHKDGLRSSDALTNHFTEIGHLTRNQVPDFRGNCRALSSACITCFLKYQSQRGNVRIGLQMIRHFTDGVLFFETGPELRIKAYDVSQTSV